MVRGWMLPIIAGGGYAGMSIDRGNGGDGVKGFLAGAAAGLGAGLAVQGVAALVRGARAGGKVAASAAETADIAGSAMSKGVSPQELLIRRRIEAMQALDAFNLKP